jgi:formate dehydrogenase subunit delta
MSKGKSPWHWSAPGSEVIVAVPSEIRLATEIAAQFGHLPPGETAEAIAAHIRRFWEPRMRARLINQVTQAREDCDRDVVAAVGVLEHKAH